MAAAARWAGIPVETFASACQRGDIPVRLERLGARGMRFVHVEEFTRWMSAREAAK